MTAGKTFSRLQGEQQDGRTVISEKSKKLFKFIVELVEMSFFLMSV
jgi:hypothetical protein